MVRVQGFRVLYYFRHGWGDYVGFILSALSTLITTYFLVIENYQSLEIIFPTLTHYVLIIGGILIPILIMIGYIHWKKSGIVKAELAILYEENPYVTRIIVDLELILKLNLKLENILNLVDKGKISKEEHDELQEFQNELIKFTNTRKFRSKDDWNYFKNKVK